MPNFKIQNFSKCPLYFRWMLEIYNNPVAIEPLIPIAERGRLAELSFEILQESGRLSGMVRSPWVFQEVASVVRGMNTSMIEKEIIHNSIVNALKLCPGVALLGPRDRVESPEYFNEH
jgi:hypothetical protein